MQGRQYNFDRSGAQRLKDQGRNYIHPDASNSQTNNSVPLSRNLDPCFLVIRNDTGSAIEVYNVVKLGAYIGSTSFDAKEFQLRPVLEGQTPDANDKERFAIVVRRAESGRQTPAIIIGVVTCKIDVTNEAHQFCQAKDGSVTELESSDGGSAQILWKEAGTGVKNALIRIGGGSGGGGFSYACVKLSANLAHTGYSVSGVILHHVGSIADAVGDTVTLTNTIQTFDGVTDDICWAIPRPNLDGSSGTEYEIFIKPCAPNTVNTPTINTNP